MNNSEKGKFGEEYVANYYRKIGYEVRRRVKGERGFDLLVEKNGEQLKVEVKTSNNHFGGIPDMHDSEFVMVNEEWKLIADRLVVVRLDEDNPIQLDILTKEEVDSYSSSHRTVTAIRTTKLDRDLFKGKVGRMIRC